MNISLGINVSNSGGDGIASNAVKNKTVVTHEDSVRAFYNIQSIGTGASEDITYGDIDIAERHLVVLTNKSAANFVTVTARKDVTPTDTVVAVLYPGESMQTFAQGQSGGYPKLRAQADTAACNLEVVAYEAKVPAA